MLAYQLITSHYPAIHTSDKISVALQLMDDFDVQHLPVLVNDKYVGLIHQNDLLELDADSLVEEAEKVLLRRSVKGGDHFFAALKLANGSGLSLVPVVNETAELLGSIPESGLVSAASKFLAVEDPGALIVLEMEKKHYSFGEISRLVETNDAYITQFNTSHETESGLLLVTIKINKVEVSDIIATFQRYEYNVRYFIGEEDYENEIRYNYDHLMSYLKM